VRIAAGDYEQHMAAIGQAAANAEHLREFLGSLAAGARVLVAGAGPGQFFDYLGEEVFARLRVVYSDVSEGYLRRLRERAPGAACVVDDIEQSGLAACFEAVTSTLVLEHVDWRRGVATLCGYGAERVLVVMQVNPERMETAVAPGRRLPGTLEAVRDLDPGLLHEPDVIRAFEELGYEPADRRRKAVADGKSMVALELRRLPLRG